MKKAAFKFGDTLDYAELAIPLTAMSSDFTTGGAVLATGKLSDKPGATLTPGMPATSGDVTVTVPAGAMVDIDPLVYTTPDSEKLRTVSIPVANVGPVLDPVMAGSMPADFKLLYGLAPARDDDLPGSANDPSPCHTRPSRPTTSVGHRAPQWRFWVMTTDVGQTYAPYAGWAKASDGTVSADGKKRLRRPRGSCSSRASLSVSSPNEALARPARAARRISRRSRPARCKVATRFTRSAVRLSSRRRGTRISHRVGAGASVAQLVVR